MDHLQSDFANILPAAADRSPLLLSVLATACAVVIVIAIFAEALAIRRRLKRTCPPPEKPGAPH